MHFMDIIVVLNICIIVLSFAEAFYDNLLEEDLQGFPHSGFFPGLQPILLSLCVHAFLLLLLYVMLH